MSLAYDVAFTHVTTVGGSDGTITVTPTSGTSPYTFSWTGPVGFADPGNVSAVTGLAPGSYEFYIIDNVGNEATGTQVINDYVPSSSAEKQKKSEKMSSGTTMSSAAGTIPLTTNVRPKFLSKGSILNLG